MKKIFLGVISFTNFILIPSIGLSQVGGTIMPTPEPTSLLLIISGLIGVLGFRKVFKK